MKDKISLGLPSKSCAQSFWKAMKCVKTTERSPPAMAAFRAQTSWSILAECGELARRVARDGRDAERIRVGVCCQYHPSLDLQHFGAALPAAQ